MARRRLGAAPVVVSSTASITLALPNDFYVYTGTGTTWTLPAVATSAGNRITVYHRGSGTLTISLSSSIHFNGAVVSSLGITAGTYITLESDGTYWTVIALSPIALGVANFAGSAIVTAAETIAANNNDTTLPTSAAVAAAIGGGSGMLLPAQYLADGGETYTIASGSVTQIAGTTINGVAVSIGDRILCIGVPLASGAGSQYSRTNNPGNGVYVVTGNTTNTTVIRAPDVAGSNHPGGKTIFVENGTWNPASIWSVTNPFTAATFTYGTGNISWSGTGGVNLNSNSIYLASNSGLLFWNGNGTTTVAYPSVNEGNTSFIPARLDSNGALYPISQVFLTSQSVTTLGGANTVVATIATPRVTIFTGTNTHTYRLPTTGVAAGNQWTVINNSTLTILVQSSDATAVVNIPSGSTVTFTAKVATPTTPAGWDAPAQANWPINAQTGTTYTIAIIDVNGVITANNAAAQTYQFPQNSAVPIPIGAEGEIHVIGAGQLTLTNGTGATVVSRGSVFKSAGQEAVIGWRKISTNGFRITGDLVA